MKMIVRLDTNMVSLSASKIAVTQLEDLLTRASDKYYNENKFLRTNIANKYPAAYKLLTQHFDITGNVQTITNDVFDSLFEFLREVSPDSAVLKRTRAPIKTGRGKAPKVKLKYWLGSLDKKNPQTVDDWLRKHNGPYVVSNKMDGTSLLGEYSNGALHIFKGGDGFEGQDVSHLIPHLRLPNAKKISGSLDVRGEVIMSEAAFNTHWSKKAPEPKGKKGFENARNLASGVLNTNDVHEAIEDIDVVVYEILGSKLKPSAQFAKLKQLGFHVAPYQVYDELDSAKLERLLKMRRDKSAYEIDGLVVTQDRVVPVEEGSNPEHSIAFKSAAEGSIVRTTVIDVVWEVSKGNLMKPRINVAPVRIAGVTVNYANGHNAYFIRHGYTLKEFNAAKKRGETLPIKPIGPGAVVMITRAGEVIPDIVEVVKAVKRPSMPNCEYEIKGPEAVLIGDSDLGEQKRITHFFSTLKVEGLKLGMITKLHVAGLDSVVKIVKASPAKLMTVEGIQSTSANKLAANIKQALAKATMGQLMDASSVFGQGLGTKNFTIALRKFPKLLEMPDTMNVSAMARKFEEIDNFSEIRAKQLATGLPKFLKFYKELGIKVAEPVAAKPVGSALKGQVVVFTGFRDATLESQIAAQGGTVSSGVSKNTTILLAKSPNDSGGKLDKARALNIPIMTSVAFKKKFRL